jgi:hypothetical protein
MVERRNLVDRGNFWQRLHNIFSYGIIFVFVVILSTYILGTSTSELNLQVRSAAMSILAGCVIAFIFEMFSKREMLERFMEISSAQRDLISNGATKVEVEATAISYDISIAQSDMLVIGSRYSASLLFRNANKIIERLKKGKAITIINCDPSDENIKRMFDGAKTKTIDDFVAMLGKEGVNYSRLLKVVKVKSSLSYSFVQDSHGIWVKLYFNSKTVKYPPAIYFEAGSPLYSVFADDITRLMI